MANNTNHNWQHRLLNLEKTWQYSQGYGIIVGLLDSNIESSQSAILISSIAGGVKYILSEESDYEPNQAEIIDKIHHAIDSGCHVFCCSKSFRDLQYEKEWEEVIVKAFNNNLIIVAPTGNDNRRHIDFPAGLEGIVSVGSCDEIGNRWIQNHWNGSNYGEKIDCVCPTYHYPRSWIWQTIDGGGVACANMCGVIGLLKSVKKNLSFHEIQDLIKQYSSHSVIGWNQEIGIGIPDVFRMLASIIPSDVNTENLIKRLRIVGLEIDSIIEELGG
jgi:hypothetical protein